VAAYNEDTSDVAVFNQTRSVYPLGSIQQRILEPLAGAQRDAEGTINLTVRDGDLATFNLDDDEKLRSQFDDLANGEFDDEQNDIERLQNLARIYSSSYDTSEWNQVIADQLATFKGEEKYNFVRDLRDSYRDSLSTNVEAKIFNTIPDYVFWDIKKPLSPERTVRSNRYNPLRGADRDFFEMRNMEEYHVRQKNRDNLNDSTTLYSQY